MSSIYNIDFGLAASRLSPPAKRKPIYQAWMKALFSPLQWLRGKIFDDYANSSNATLFNGSTIYHFGDIVRYEKAVFQNISSSGSTNIFPSNTDYWYLIQENYIGVRERLIYNSQTIVLRAILNKAFNSEDILIDNTDNDIDFVYFYNEEEKYDTTFYYLPEADTGLRQDVLFLYNESEYSPEFDFIVKLPSILNSGNIKQLVAAEVEKYKIAGASFNVVFYTVS